MNIASNIKISEPSIAVFNSLGYDNKGLIEVNGHINKEIEKFGQKIKNGIKYNFKNNNNNLFR